MTHNVSWAKVRSGTPSASNFFGSIFLGIGYTPRATTGNSTPSSAQPVGWMKTRCWWPPPARCCALTSQQGHIQKSARLRPITASPGPMTGGPTRTGGSGSGPWGSIWKTKQAQSTGTTKANYVSFSSRSPSQTRSASRPTAKRPISPIHRPIKSCGSALIPMVGPRASRLATST